MINVAVVKSARASVLTAVLERVELGAKLLRLTIELEKGKRLETLEAQRILQSLQSLSLFLLFGSMADSVKSYSVVVPDSDR